MRFFCRRCDELVFGEPFRVISEEDGIIFLDMTVCRSCGQEAQGLGLHLEPVRSESQSRQTGSDLFSHH